MKFKLINRKITFRKDGLMVFTAKMFNDQSPSDNPQHLPTYSIINQQLIKQIVENPQKFEYIDNMYQYTAHFDHYLLKVNKNGLPECNKRGEAKAIKEMTIWMKKTFDEDYNDWVWVEDPMQVIHRILFHHYRPLDIPTPTEMCNETLEERKDQLVRKLEGLRD